MSTDFNGQILVEKLSRLNNSQQSIGTLSNWCIIHRKKAKQVVETWEKLFNSCQKEQRVPFLHLANDILQNSRRKGSEFVNEFWKVLPKALKEVTKNGDELGMKAVTRLETQKKMKIVTIAEPERGIVLVRGRTCSCNCRDFLTVFVDIWEERSVFGSRGRGLKDEIFGKELPKDPPTLLESNGKSFDSIKIVKKDAHSIRIKMAVGGMPEKIVTAFQSVLDEHFNEDTALNKCRAAVRHMKKMERDVADSNSHGNEHGSALSNELEEQETILMQSIQQLESCEATRAALVARLKEAHQEQESKLEVIRTQVHIAQTQTELATKLRQRISQSSVSDSRSAPKPSGSTITNTPPFSEADTSQDSSPLPIVQTSFLQPPLPQPITSFTNLNYAPDEQQKKAAAAAMAAKLAASTSSAQMLSSLLSSLAAEEASAASTNGGGSSSGPFTTTSPIFSPAKRTKLEKPMPISDITNTTYITPMSHTNQLQPSFPPPPPPLPPGLPQMQQYMQYTGMMVGAQAYGHNTSGSSGLPPPNSMPGGLVRPPNSQPQLQQFSTTAGFYPSSPGVGFYSQAHQPTAPTVPRQ